MTRIITYSLRLGAGDSDDYYRTIARFADEWVAGALRLLQGVVEQFRQFRRDLGLLDRTDAEYAFELLALGALLHEHGNEAAQLATWWLRLMAWLVAAQERWPKAQAGIKWLRGQLGRFHPQARTQLITVSSVDRLIDWLRASGQEAKAERLAEWLGFFRKTPQQEAHDILLRCLTLARFFASDSNRVFGRYTAGVEGFVHERAPRYRGRYDAEFVSRTPLEYHLGMLGTEILNRAYRDRFRSTRRKIVIVPPCMRAQPDEKCKAIGTPFGAKCQACTPTCRVHQITKLGEKRGFDVYIIPDELRAIGAGATPGSVGLVGVSCALTNWSGGWETDALGVPAQGVLLDYVGCKYHWDEEGIPTDTNLKQLQAVVTGGAG